MGDPAVTTIWKFQLDIMDEQTVMMPKGAVIIRVDSPSATTLNLWAIINREAPTEGRLIHVYGTGSDIPYAERLEYLGTTTPYPLVWHVFEVIEMVEWVG